jgi:predicted phosphodiesterase
VRLHVLSDLHLERAPFEPPPSEADVVILAGDVARGSDGVRWARNWSGAQPVLYVAGNHEFYGHAWPDLLATMREAAEGSAVRVLEDEQAVIAGVRFLGCTLWSDFAVAGEEQRKASMSTCARVVLDYRVIRRADRTLTPADTLAVHETSRRWLEARLAEPHPGPTVVITHHAPLIRSRPASPLMRAVAGAFVSDLTELMGDDRVDLWVFGHTHVAADLDIRGTRVMSNPRGYPRQEIAGWDPARVVEL